MAKKSFLSNISGNLNRESVQQSAQQSAVSAAPAVRPAASAPLPATHRKGFLESYAGALLEGDAADVIPINLDNISRKRASRAIFAEKEVRLSAFVDADLYEKVQKVADLKHVPLQDILNQLLRQYVQTNWKGAV